MFRLRDLVPRQSDLAQLVLLFATYAATAVLGLRWGLLSGAATPVWPASGVALAGLLLGGLRLWPAVFLGRIAASLMVGATMPIWATVELAAVSAMTVVICAAGISGSGRFDPRLGRLRDMARLILIGAVLGAVISTVLSLPLLPIGGLASGQMMKVVETWAFGYGVGVLVFAPLILSWYEPQAWRMRPFQWLHLGGVLLLLLFATRLIFLEKIDRPLRTWHIFPILVWAALAFSVRGASLALLLTSAVAIWSAIQGVGPMSEFARSTVGRILIAQQFAGSLAITVLVLAAAADERRGKEQIAESERRLLAETEALETLNTTGALIAAELDIDSLVQKVTDAGVALTGAKFGAFFYNVVGEDGGGYALYTLSGAPREAFERFGMPRATAVFAPTFQGEGVVRSDDIRKDPRYGHNPPHNGQPKGHLPVRSYLAAPVRSRSGEVLGGLFFGHPEVGVFDDRSERLAVGLAAQAASALDNAHLYQGAQREIEERRRAEARQRLLINELNHRVKNTLATVQSIAAQTRRSAGDPRASYEAFVSRLVALSQAHDVLTGQQWEGADLREIVAGAVKPFNEGDRRFRIAGPSAWLDPQMALALAMALHELATNAVKYGALSAPDGHVEIGWTVAGGGEEGEAPRLDLVWREVGGPPVKAPTRRGFGSRLLGRGLASELNGEVHMDYLPDGLVCRMTARLSAPAGERQAAAE